jgi:phage regulator Rha-like protein
MNELVTLKKNDVFTTSRVIAEGTNNKHKNVKELILKYKKDLQEFGTFSVLNVESTGGRPEEYYLLNEEQATFLITLLRNSKTVVVFKKELVRQFYAMRKFIMERQTEEWRVTRKQGKLTRKNETDVLKQLVEYAKVQGSKNADKLYITYSKLANKAISIQGRDKATIMELNNLSLAENIILHCIKTGMAAGKHYKEIYQDSRTRLEMFKDIAFLGGDVSEEVAV